MTGENNLATLLRHMQPVQHPGVYVFCTGDNFDLEALKPVCTFREAEGMTAIILKDDAEKAGLNFIYPCRMITLNIHSDLNAVGFLAAITTKLAAHGVSVNAISAYYHDHLFVPVERADDVMKLLLEFSAD